MSLNCFSLSCKSSKSSVSQFKPKNKLNLSTHWRLNSFCIPNSLSFPYSFSTSTIKCRLQLSFEDIAAITQNKVLIAAGASAAIGQFSKPFTSFLLYGNHFDFKAVIQAGGFPSTHSSAVVATATSLALERGFSDSIFGLTVVYAALVMYDAQGVRREVGIHARTINKALLMGQTKSVADRDTVDTNESSTNSGSLRFSEEVNGPINERAASPLVVGTRLQDRLVADTGKESERSNSYTLLKESVGHTEIEVIAGALLGLLVSLTVHAFV